MVDDVGGGKADTRARVQQIVDDPRFTLMARLMAIVGPPVAAGAGGLFVWLAVGALSDIDDLKKQVAQDRAVVQALKEGIGDMRSDVRDIRNVLYGLIRPAAGEQ